MLPFSQRQMQMVPFNWVPWGLDCRFTRYGGDPQLLIWQGWLYLPFGLALLFRIDMEPEERVVVQFGPFTLARRETDEEREEREWGEAEEAFMERELYRYCEWAY